MKLKIPSIPFLSFAAGLIAFASGSAIAQDAASASAASSLPDIRVVIHTDKGDIEATIYASKAPVTSANFLNLAKSGFYNGLTFHRVIPGFMTQGGDPEGSGKGGPGYKFADEQTPGLHFDRAGVIAMANAGPNTNGSQFFITHGPTPHLNDGGAAGGHYNIFGQVAKGQNIVFALRQGDHIKSIDILDSTDALFTAESAHIAEWNASLPKPGR